MELEHGIRGIASVESDFDIRFLYIRPREEARERADANSFFLEMLEEQ